MLFLFQRRRTFFIGVLLCLLVGVTLHPTPPTQAADILRPWGSRPMLYHYLGSSGDGRNPLPQQFPAQKLSRVLAISNQEQAQIRALETRWQAALAPNTAPTSAQVQEYNRSLEAILSANATHLRQYLGHENFAALVAWLEKSWNQERTHLVESLLKPDSSLQAKTYPRSFDVYATRYEAGDRYIVALPDKCVKFANSGAMRCSDGYQFNQNYSVAISYKGKMVVATVLESGPWNIDDAYWSKTSDPQPRRMFTDLGLGVPEAQAAFYNGYNGGLDQFGRKVTSPVAIDISYKVAKDLDLPSGNTLVTVSFLWTEGWDKARPDSNSDPAATQPPLSIPNWVTSTPNLDGSVVHTVLSGQTLIGVSAVYGISLDELLKLNQLTKNSLIFPGDQLLIKPASVTPTLAMTVTPTKTLAPSPTASLSPPVPSPTPSLAPAPMLPSATYPVSDGFSQQNPSLPSALKVLLGAMAFLFLCLLVWYILPRKK